MKIVFALGQYLIPRLFVAVVDFWRQLWGFDSKGLKHRVELIVEILEIAVPFKDIPFKVVARVVIVNAQATNRIFRALLVADTYLELDVVTDVAILPEENLHVDWLSHQRVSIICQHVLIAFIDEALLLVVFMFVRGACPPRCRLMFALGHEVLEVRVAAISFLCRSPFNSFKFPLEK